MKTEGPDERNAKFKAALARLPSRSEAEVLTESLVTRLACTTLDAKLKLIELTSISDWAQSPDYPIRDHLRLINGAAWRYLLIDRKFTERDARSLLEAVECLYADTLTFYDVNECPKDWHEWMCESQIYSIILDSWGWAHSGESGETDCLPDLAAKCGGLALVWADVYAVFVLRLVTEAVAYLSAGDYLKGAAIALNAMDTAKLQMACAWSDDSWVKARQELGALGSTEKYRRDPKQTEKRNVKARWAEWQVDQTLYANKTAFAKKVLNECVHLTSEKHITDLCRKWEKL